MGRWRYQIGTAWYNRRISKVFLHRRGPTSATMIKDEQSSAGLSFWLVQPLRGAICHNSKNERTIGLINSGRVSGAMWPPPGASL